MPEIDPRVIGERIKQLRRLRGWSQEELASRAVVHRQTVHRYEQGTRRRQELPTLEKIADAFGMEVSEIMMPSVPAVATVHPIGYNTPVTFVPRVEIVQHDGSEPRFEQTGYYVPVTSQLALGRALVAVRYELDDMAPDIRANDDVIVDTVSRTPAVGDLVLVVAAGVEQSVVRRYQGAGYPEGATVLGVVVGIFRAFQQT